MREYYGNYDAVSSAISLVVLKNRTSKEYTKIRSEGAKVA
jgi:hypothetical protein